MKLNEKGQCPVCLIKPLIYKREGKKFCHRCARDFSLATGEWIANFSWQAPTVLSERNQKIADMQKSKLASAKDE